VDVKKLVAAIKAFFATKNIQLGENDAALEAEVERLMKDNSTSEFDLSKLDLSKFGNSGTEKVLQAVLANQTKLENAVTSIATMVKQSADSVKAEKDAIEASKKTQHETDVKKAVDGLIITKKAFPEAMREHLTKVATADLDSFNIIYKDAKAGKEFTPEKPGEEGNKNVAVKSTSGNSKALKAIQEFQANSASVESTETK